MKINKLFLLLAALIVALSMTACDWRLQSPVVKVTPEPTPLVSVPPTPTPTPEGPAYWVPRENVELDELFRNPEYALGHDTNIACSGSPAVDAHASFDATFPDWVEEMYPNGIDIFCPSYVAWQICAETSFPLACEIDVLEALEAGDEEAVAEIVAENDSTDVDHEEADAIATPSPTAVPTVTETQTMSNTVVLLDGMVTLTGFPEEAETVRWGYDLGRSDQDCGVPELAWLICNPGVLSFDEFNDHDEENPSAVWSGGANVDNAMSTMIEQFLNPGNGYMKTNWAGGWIRYNSIELYMEPTDNVSFMFVSRGQYAEEGGGQTPVEYEVTDEEYRGAAKIMRYPIEDPDASGFYSWTHFHEDVLHQLAGDNCDYDGCGMVVIIATDVNRDNVTVSTYTAADGYTTIYTNSRTQ